MAEFVSAIIEFVAVGAKTGNGLHSPIDTFKDAPNEIRALSDEVDHFQAMLSKLLDLDDPKEWASEKHDAAKIGVGGMVKNGQQIIEKIGALIEKARRERLAKDGENQVNKFQWVRMVRKERNSKNH
ncbi:hypothetical protein K458DRAFT_317874 [Lentithecium fluviatile CBS 122367]|uniref:Uncharacterized protein n=1 Tax=Lentithecium fluviatile CBS 122367 TaxID=1168545 RepID=A0A6G1IIM7_9PLEO|nr:hypothetical protein K458DRAFT_317874 [Lentithecium fluviatile CBS 122367]